MRQLFLDTETTGLSADAGDRVIELGCIEMVNRRLTGRNLHFYFNPERPNHEDAVAIHGLTDAFLADKPLFKSQADEIAEYLRGAEIIIHNAAFDVGFLNAEFRRTGHGKVHDIVGGVVDSLTMAREMFPGKSNSLDALCRRLEVDNTNRTLHGALLDAGLLAEVYIRMTRGQDSLMIDMQEGGSQQLQVEQVDLSAFTLKVLAAGPAEVEAHDALLLQIDKSSNGKTTWRNLVA